VSFFCLKGDIDYRELIPMRKKKIAAVALALWLTIISVLMLLSERIDLALFFILAFIGFLVIVELLEPRYVKPRYQLYIHALIAVEPIVGNRRMSERLLQEIAIVERVAENLLGARAEIGIHAILFLMSPSPSEPDVNAAAAGRNVSSGRCGDRREIRKRAETEIPADSTEADKCSDRTLARSKPHQTSPVSTTVSIGKHPR
jgi:hypothetical protein